MRVDGEKIKKNKKTDTHNKRKQKHLLKKNKKLKPYKKYISY